MSVGLIILLAELAILGYFAPAIIAYWRDKPNRLSIFVANALFGWTLLGWGLCLVWSVGTDRRETTL